MEFNFSFMRKTAPKKSARVKMTTPKAMPMSKRNTAFKKSMEGSYKNTKEYGRGVGY